MTRYRTTFVADRLQDIETALAAGDWPSARQAASLAAVAAPADAHVLHATGRLCELADMPDQAVEQWLHALAIDPSIAASWSAVATILCRGVPLTSPHALALMLFAQATRADPEWIMPGWHLAQMYHALGHREAADAALVRVRQALLLHHSHPKNLGSSNVHNRAYMHLSLGQLEMGYACYEERLNDVGHTLNDRAQSRPPAGVPRWTDRDRVPASLAIFVEQGAGDMLMCLRYARALVARGVTVQLEVFPSMADYVRSRPTHPLLTVIDQDAPLVAPVEAYVWAMSLPGLMGTVLGAHPARGQHHDGQDRVAFAWQGSRAHKSDRIRSAPVETFKPLAELVRSMGYVPVALNPGEPIPAWLDDPGPITSFAETARLLDTCAAVVSVDTALVHLAGVEGVPTFAALAALPDWRWGLSGTGTHWYPSATLARQTTIGDWQSVVDQITPQLTALITPSDKATA